jgi:hypothetical protein
MRTKLFILSLAILLALSACAPAAANDSTINVTGSGTVYVTPDIAYIYIGVHTEDLDIKQAVNSNNILAQAVVDALRNGGVDAQDIQTSNFNIYSYQKSDPLSGLNIGLTYSVDNTVFVKVRDLSKLSSLLDTAIGAGANNINSVSFDVADKSTAMLEARRLAMENAGVLANELALTAGLSLGGIQNITYSDVTTSYYGYGIGGGAEGAKPASTPINPGQVQLTASVNVIYGIK